MIAAPRLLTGRRRGLAAGLVLLALTEALLAVLFAAAIDRLLAQQGPPAIAAIGAAGIVLAAALALLANRWVGEDFAQCYVTDCRALLFTAAMRSRNRSTGKESRWLTCLINDMAALRNYALRGTVRLWTSSLSAGAAGAWVLYAIPAGRPALMPLLIGAIAMILLIIPLHRAIADQRSKRGRLNRFLVRRIRPEATAEPSPRGQGFRKLERLSGDLSRLSVTRALGAGAMDAVATAAGLAAALMLVWKALESADQNGLAGSLALFGFIAARLLETGRALHAWIAGRVALVRLSARLNAARSRSTISPSASLRPRSDALRRRAASRWFWSSQPLLLPSPGQTALPQEPSS